MGKFVSNLFLWILAIALSIFTASRTLDLLAQWLPANQEIYRWLALAGFEGGFYFWSFYFATAAEGAAQRGLALVMVVVDFLGIAVATVADLVLTGAKDGRLPQLNSDMQQSIVVFIGIVLVVNVGAFLACKLMSPEKLRQWAMQDAEDQIHHEELRAIKGIAPSVAVSLAPQRAGVWVDQTWNRLLPGSVPPSNLLPAPAGQQEQTEAVVQGRVVQDSRPVERVERGPSAIDRVKGFLFGGQRPATAGVSQVQATLQPVAKASRPFMTETSTDVRRRLRLEQRRRKRSGRGQ